MYDRAEYDPPFYDVRIRAWKWGDDLPPYPLP
jgi:hypothetical protein